MQINTASQPVAAQAASNANTTTKQAVSEQQAVAEPQTLQADTVSISAQAQEQQAQEQTLYSGSGGGTWPTKPK
ncbi:hypothetical protein [Pseudoalteromonas sp. GW168-MNA-CIBAN-0100]|uniref:hypothetical protein n=1 Tax=Pseudoalteromonas sp. GW168-MNA-CIBAN-0100 TaxID=3140434 RepID=UPI00331CBA12